MINYDSATKIFTIKLDDIETVEQIESLHNAYAEYFKKMHDGGGYKILLDARKYPHKDFTVDRKLRELFGKTVEKESHNECLGCAIVNTEERMSHQDRLQTSERECFFKNKIDAIAWLKTL